MSEMDERVAAVMNIIMVDHPTTADVKQFARSAIAAMREPTPRMIQAGYACLGNTVEVWTAMIDEALK